MRLLHVSLSLAVALLLSSAGCGSDSGKKDVLKPRADLFPWSTRDTGGGGCSNCSGCCQYGQCQNGNSSAACGYGGLACRTCAANEQCKNGVCVAGGTCDVTNCKTGCCDTTGNCKQGDTDQACGSNAQPCKTCDTASQSCTQGQCLAKNASYKVVLVSAVIVNNDCDYLSSCDPYVILKVGSASKQSDSVSNEQNPVWNAELLTATATDLTAGMQVGVWDYDWPDPDNVISSCTLTPTGSDLSAGKLVQPCGNGVKDLTFQFKPI